MPENLTYKIQEFFRPRDGFPRELYCGGSGGKDAKKHLIGLAPEESYSGNTYFNSLYVDYWLKYTPIRKFGVQIAYRGDAELQVIACDRSGKETTLKLAELSSRKQVSSSQIWFDLPDFSHANGCRIFIKIQAKGAFTASEIAYVSDCAPQQSVGLSIGLCTYKREVDLAHTLEAIAEIKPLCPEIKKITIVNHDKPFTERRLKSNAKNLAAKVIDQPNLGGCGGFNRTMYEVENSDQEITHHLLMDDDIELDPNVLRRAITFLSYAHQKTVVGGHMFDSVNRTVLHEAGARLDPFWYVISLFQDEDMASETSLSHFCRVKTADYNAWWFCIFPVAAIREIGYSPPIFIHGDDIEYGCRLGEFGYETVSMPGVAVWHESFSGKNTDWLEYYDLRNRLIISSSHSKKHPQPDTLYCFGFLMHMLLMHRYRSFEMCVAALNDFLGGPDKLFKIGADKLHQNVSETGKNIDVVSTVRDVQTDQLVKHSPNKATSSQLKIAVNFVRSLVLILLLPTPSRARDIHTKKSANPAVILNKPYLLINGTSGNEYLEFRPSRKQVVLGTAKALSVSLRYLFKRRAATRNWNEKLPGYQTRSAWEEIFFTDRTG